MLNNQFIYALLIGLILPVFSTAQTRPLSLSEALSLADENNLSAKSAAARVEAAKASFRISNSVFLPSVDLSHTGISTNDPLSSFGFKLKQEIVTPSDFDPDLLNDPGSIENFMTKAQLKQPLLNLDGIYARKAAKNQFEAITLQHKRIRHDIRFEVKNAYYLLDLAQSSMEVLDKSVKVAEEAFRLTQNNAEQGFAKHADVLEASVRVDERKDQLLEATNQYEQAHDYLAHLLGIGLNETIETTDSLISPPVQALVNSTAISIENRSDVLAFQKQIEAGENMLRAQKMKFVPRINAFGAVEWNDSQFFGTSANNYMFGASLSWSLFNGYKNTGAIQHADAQLSEARINYEDFISKNQLRINTALRKINLGYNRIQSSKKANEQAQEALRIRTDRFKQGLEKTADLLMAEALASEKELQYIQSVYKYKQSVFEMELLLEQDINE